MGELQNAVSALLDAFARGIAVIKTQQAQRKKERRPIDSTLKTAETLLSKSFKENKADLRDAYGRDLARFGPSFAVGDAESRSSLLAILFRLNAGFVSVIERFIHGRSTPTDYQALVNLSTASRMEAINTFEQLSQRLSQSSVALVPSRKQNEKRGHKKKSKSSSSLGNPKHARSKSAPQPSSTSLGQVRSDGWIRPKGGKKLPSSNSKAMGKSVPKHSIASPSSASPPQMPILSAPPAHDPAAHLSSPMARASPHPPPPIPRATHPCKANAATLNRPTDRKSIMSFASDSTKLGEIPEHKWTRPVEGGNFEIRPYYPLEPYQEPQKPRSRFMRLFKRS